MIVRVSDHGTGSSKQIVQRTFENVKRVIVTSLRYVTLYFEDGKKKELEFSKNVEVEKL